MDSYENRKTFFENKTSEVDFLLEIGLFECKERRNNILHMKLDTYESRKKFFENKSFQVCDFDFLFELGLFEYKMRRSNSARIIQRNFKNAISNPSYEICKNRLKKEYSEITI